MTKFGKALDKGLDILETLQSSYEPLSFSELKERINVSPASFARFLKLLLQREYIVRNEQGLYSIGIRAIQVGLSGLERLPLTAITRSHLKEITETTEESSEISLFEEGTFTFLHREECQRSVILRGRPGNRFDIQDNTAIGRVGLAFGYGKGPASLDSGIAETVKKLLFAEMLQNDNEVYRGASPVFNNTGACIGCLSIAAPAFRIKSSEKKRFRSILTDHARRISAKLGSIGQTAGL